jgi:GNAT superfamily N-acetyltransferase
MSTTKSKNLIVRQARSDELDQVALVLKAAYQEYEKTLPPQAWESYLEDIMDVRSRLPEAELIVAELNGRLAGTVTLNLNSSESADSVWPKGWAGLRLLGVHPAYRGYGVGRALMDYCIRRCRELGIKTIGLHTTTFMEVARGMYERMGFVRMPQYDFHPRPGTVVMAYRLDL